MNSSVTRQDIIEIYHLLCFRTMSWNRPLARSYWRSANIISAADQLARTRKSAQAK